MNVTEAQRTRRRSNTRARLIEATDALIGDTGRTWFSVEEVCRAAGYTRGAFYSSYDGMENLLFEVYGHQNDALVERLRNMAEPLLNSAGVLETDRVVRHLLKAGVADQPRIALHAALVARAAHQPDIARALDAQVERLREGLQQIFVELIAKTGRTLTVTPEVFTRALMAAQAGASGQFLSDRAATEEVRYLTALAVVEGLST
ncbi:TetR/AcrR family transcriptional regulator [Mycobacterium sp. PSTR-4-N]|uniref:TetR/AcrR family transcriptional regulator n=1 Tax=Mycobacterium sp. PSTR-4-N TaxID=2917745 RepID=UPI001F150F2F|nr:TetR/AcrR family transcriptional regulator [Mycobacterium sp. PSTR-4-N]MCG7592481.1 TetR/AcrR family transcriptional regulator [Mycobacterium sp. PSTR-4-N]